MKKILRTAVNVLSIFVIIAALFVLLSVVMTKPGQPPNVLGYSSFRVLTGSMEPTVRTGSMIIVKRVSPSDITEGDVITFYSSDPSLGGSVNTHRVVGVSDVDGIRIFSTKGDANLIADEYEVLETDLIGKMTFSSYFLGVLVRILSNPVVFIPIIVIPLLAILVINMIKTVNLARAAAKEEEEKAVAEALEALKKADDTLPEDSGSDKT